MKDKAPKGKKAPAAKGPKAAPRPCRGCLLLVEDHEPTRNELQKILIAKNFEVRAAGSVAEAWELVDSVRFDFLVSDIGLPDGDGFILMRELQDRYGMRGIALTGFDMDEDFRLSQEAGFLAHLVKPVAARVLDRALSDAGL